MNKYNGAAEIMRPRAFQPQEIREFIELLCQAPEGQVDLQIVLHFYDWKKLSLESLPNAIQQTLDAIVKGSLASDFVVSALNAFKHSVEKRLESQEVKT